MLELRYIIPVIRTPKTSNKKEVVDEEKKKRPVWRPKKNKILVQYPEYIQVHLFKSL